MQEDTSEVQDTPAAEPEAKESIQEYEARVSTEGLQIEAEEPEETPVQETEGTPEAEAPVEAPKGPDLAQVLAAQVEAANRQTQLLELLAQARAEPTKIEPAGPTPVEQFTRLLTDRHAMAAAMQHEDINLDPTDTKDVALFRNMVSHELEKEVTKAKDSRISALEEKLKGWETAAQTQFKGREAQSAWTEATKDYNIDAEVGETLSAAVTALVQEGTSPKEAVQAVLKPFLKILPKKTSLVSTDPQTARALAAAAVVGKGANRISPFKKGTTDTASIKDFESKFFRNN